MTWICLSWDADGNSSKNMFVSQMVGFFMVMNPMAESKQSP